MFKLLLKNSLGRKGKVATKHGTLVTPFFMPDATRSYIKLITREEIKKTGISALVVNTFYLYLQPGLETIKKAGGVHKFMNWSGPLLSDSGGYQVFSLIHRNNKLGKIYNDKVVFKSPLDGSYHEFTPEKSIQIQFDLGVDMMVCLDDCPPNEFNRKEMERSVERTIAWAKRSKEEYLRQIKKRKLIGKDKPLLFSVVQGGKYLDLRKKCAEELVKIGFDGYGFGARPVDEQGNFLGEVLKKTASYIPEDSLRFALGIGTPEDIKKCVKMGWDMFDCVIPTREGRHGKLFMENKSININNSKYITNFRGINSSSNIKELREYSKAYLHHLFKMKEPLGQKLASLNNLEYYANLLKRIRDKIYEKN